MPASDLAPPEPTIALLGLNLRVYWHEVGDTTHTDRHSRVLPARSLLLFGRHLRPQFWRSTGEQRPISFCSKGELSNETRVGRESLVHIRLNG
jgi:hypothetical protein